MGTPIPTTLQRVSTHLLRIPEVSEKPTFQGRISSSSMFSVMLGSCFWRLSPGSWRSWPVKSTRHTLFLLLFHAHNQSSQTLNCKSYNSRYSAIVQYFNF